MNESVPPLSPDIAAALEEGDVNALRALAVTKAERGLVSEACLAEAMAHLAEGDRASAIELLRRGLAEAPAWYLGSQLAVLMSEEGEIPETIRLLREAREAPGAPREPLTFELAAWLIEGGEAEEAERLLGSEEELRDEPEAVALRLRALVELERWSETRILAETVRAEMLETGDVDELYERADVLAAIETARALAARAEGDDRTAKKAALDALGWARGDEDALELLLELGPGPAAGAHKFRVEATIEIPMEDEDGLEPERFHTIYGVVATAVGDVPALCASVEPEDLSGLVEVEDVQDLGPAPDGTPIGVHAQSELYDLEGDEEDGDDEPAAPVALSDASPADEESGGGGQKPFRLGSFLKWCGAVQTGGEAKLRIQGGEVRVNDEVETRRGRRLAPGDQVTVDGKTHEVPPPRS